MLRATPAGSWGDVLRMTSKYTTYGLNRKEGRQKGIGINYAGNHVRNPCYVSAYTLADTVFSARTSSSR